MHENILLILVLVSKNKMTGSHSEVQGRTTQSRQPFMTFKWLRNIFLLHFLVKKKKTDAISLTVC